ncbi:uncharacterized protein [Malus domestica]|uniref:uncharacterized protein n=1 Tax=Malus domestica TaxID=3750 RepID=UPI0039770D48
MVTVSQLQLLQSPITGLISMISTSVNVKLDDSNYLNWQFQMQLLLEGHNIMGFVDGFTPCPSRYLTGSSNASGVGAETSSTPSCSYAIDYCNFLKSNLQTIKKGADSVSRYLQRIKEARDYFLAAGVIFADEDIVILALNGLPPEFNTFRSVIRGRESVISLQEFSVQLLAEELIVDSNVPSQFMSTMVANDSGGPTSTKNTLRDVGTFVVQSPKSLRKGLRDVPSSCKTRRAKSVTLEFARPRYNLRHARKLCTT